MTSLIKKILLFIFGKKQADSSLSGYVAKKSITLLFMHGLTLALGFLSNYVLIKIAGVSVYGSYIYIFNLIYLLAGFCIMGTDTLLVKKIPVYDISSDYSLLKGILFFALIIVTAGSVIVAVISGVVFDAAGLVSDKTAIRWFVLALLSLFMLSVTTVNQAFLQGLKKIILSQVTEKVIRPLLVIILVLVFFYFKKAINTDELIWLNVIAIAAGMLITLFFLGKSAATGIIHAKPGYELSAWFNNSISFFLIGIFYIVNSRIDIFLLGLFRPNDEIGVYNIALKLSEMISFGLVIINFVIAPVIAGLFERKEMVQLQKIVTGSARGVLLLGTPLLIMLILFRHPILSFFEVDFLNGQLALIILCLSQFVNIIFGSVGLLLSMTGNQRYSIYSLMSGTVLNIILNIVLVPEYGLVGTAIAASVSMIAWNCLMYFFVRGKLHIRPTAFGVV